MDLIARSARNGIERIGRAGLRLKVVTLVVAAALAPALLVGAASYLSAQATLLESTNARLATRTQRVVAVVDSWLAERRQDASIFASSFVVTGALARGSGDDAAAAARIGGYLGQVRERFPLYQTLAVIDESGREIARSGSAEPEAGAASDRSGIVWEGGATPLLLLQQPIYGTGDARIGTLMATAALTSLWQRLSGELALELGGLSLVTPDARARFEAGGETPAWQREPVGGLERCRPETAAVSRYRTRGGADVLGTCQSVPGVELVVLHEIEASTAFSSVRELRNRVLLIALGGALLVSGLAWALVIRLVRPIEALIDGARAVSGGDYSHEVKVSSRDELGYLSSVFNEMTHALRATHGQLEQLTRTDALTGLANRRHLDGSLEAELARARRNGTPLGLLMVDLDHFKAFNDRFGHPEGDALLRGVAELLRAQLRPTDTVARYGGEEFIALLPGSPRDECVRIAERIRRRLAELRTEPSGAGTTGSFGVATWPEDGETVAELVAAADAALYAAKRNGRDRIELASAATSGA